jgi:hypothetical protein
MIAKLRMKMSECWLVLKLLNSRALSSGAGVLWFGAFVKVRAFLKR